MTDFSSDDSNSIVLPLPPTSIYADAFAMDVYARFMRQLRYVPTSRADIQILASIQYVADAMDIPDIQVTKLLVDLGLRAPRDAFPACYLESCERVQQYRKFNSSGGHNQHGLLPCPV